MPRLYRSSRRFKRRYRTLEARGQLAIAPRNTFRSSDAFMLESSGCASGDMNKGLDQFACIHYPFNTTSLYEMCTSGAATPADQSQIRMEYGTSYCTIELSLPITWNSTSQTNVPCGPVEYQIYKLTPRRVFVQSSFPVASFYNQATFQNYVYSGFKENNCPSDSGNGCYRRISPLLSRTLTNNFIITKIGRERLLTDASRHRYVFRTNYSVSDSITDIQAQSYNNSVVPLANRKFPIYIIQYRGVQGSLATAPLGVTTVDVRNYTFPQINVDRQVQLGYGFYSAARSRADLASQPIFPSAAEPYTTRGLYSAIEAYNAPTIMRKEDDGE